MTELIDGEDWRTHAACAGGNPSIFYPEKDDVRAIRQAKLTCRTCPVSTDCLDAAFANGEVFGIWGGYTPEEREIIRVANRIPLRRPPNIFPHGTPAGYARHKRAGEQACRACIDGHTRDRREWKEKRREAGNAS